ncbi:MAG: InlB B-repeat-containing protein [Ruminococcus sp.]|jgi:uncharacterized repeat protein (TIGR02543 family)|nr:InlB B-repeat-containing protein [Ruminococcus sp.]
MKLKNLLTILFAFSLFCIILPLTVSAAEYAGPTYEVTYDLNGGSIGSITLSGNTYYNPNSKPRYEAGEKFLAGMLEPWSQGGKIFKEWNTEQDGTGQGYFCSFSETEEAFEASCEVTMPNGNLTLYAIWLDTYDVTVNINLDGSTYTDYGKLIGLSALFWGKEVLIEPDPAGGRAFKNVPPGTHWIDSYIYDSVEHYLLNWETLGTVTVSGNTTTTINFYTVSFNSRGGSEVPSQIILSGKIATAPTNPTKADDTFRGWSTNATTYVPFNFASTTVTGRATLYAFWNSDTDNGGDGDNNGDTDNGNNGNNGDTGNGDTGNNGNTGNAPARQPEQQILPQNDMMYSGSSDSSPYYPPVPNSVPIINRIAPREFVSNGVTATLMPDGTVIAALNPNGTVNGNATAAAVRAAKMLGKGTITVTIPEGAIGISKSACARIYRAARGTPVTLVFELAPGTVYRVKLTEETGQIVPAEDFFQ